MKRILILAAFALSSIANAEPSNSDVLNAVNNGNFIEAESMLDVVVQSHPRSAKAHYLLSEVYAKEDKVPLAKQELATALSIDPSGKFASAGKLAAYQSALNSTSKTTTTTTTSHHQSYMVQPSQQYAPPVQHSQSGLISFLAVIFILVLITVMIAAFFRSSGGNRPVYISSGNPLPYPSGGSPAYYPPVQHYGSGGMGVGSVALGAAGGLVAGMALESALNHDHGGYSGSHGYNSYDDSTTTTTTTTESTPSFDFDSGSDKSSGWDSGSSSDSGSSWDSGGSSDSGSSWD